MDLLAHAMLIDAGVPIADRRPNMHWEAAKTRPLGCWWVTLMQGCVKEDIFTRYEKRGLRRLAYTTTVSDTGVDMDEQDLVKAMSRFGQVDNRLGKKQEGTGIGLPLTHGLVELHGGSFDIHSTKGQGTTVTVRFPPERTVTS